VQASNSPAAGSEARSSDSLATVTVQIPVSVLLADKQPGAAPAPPSEPRPRKLLSDIGRKYWDKLPNSSRLSN
jgi:hypothetical protein